MARLNFALLSRSFVNITAALWRILVQAQPSNEKERAHLLNTCLRLHTAFSQTAEPGVITVVDDCGCKRCFICNHNMDTLMHADTKRKRAFLLPRTGKMQGRACSPKVALRKREYACSRIPVILTGCVATAATSVSPPPTHTYDNTAAAYGCVVTRGA